MSNQATRTRLNLGTLSAHPDAPVLEVIRATLIAAHGAVRHAQQALATDAAADLAEMLLMSLEAEIDGITAGAIILAEAA